MPTQPTKTAARRWRPEAFGAIVQLARPRALVFVDRQRARHLGIGRNQAPRAWENPSAPQTLGAATLSAPLEAHLAITNRCDAGCSGCYTGATPQGAAREWGLERWKATVDHLAEMGVFHLALGGGESATLPWLGDLAAHARHRGLIPNLTTSGLAGLDRLIEIAPLFGQINVSLDGIGATYAMVRGFDGYQAADKALVRLRAVKREIGINVVVTRVNFDELDALFRHAKKRRLAEVELLRFKPAGRGTQGYQGLRCTDRQHRQFLPRVLAAAKRHRMRARVDCSYTPMIAHHSPSPDLLGKLAVYGCTGGDFLIGARANGTAVACSFAAAPAGRPAVDQLADYWAEPDAFGAFRTWRNAEEPCASCTYHSLCRGGCRVVSAHVAGDATRPDPECPRVMAHAKKSSASDTRRRQFLPVV